VAQTKKKRQTKHRGNAAGVVEVRGRTGRPPSAEQKKRETKDRNREARLSRPPSWKIATRNSALMASLIFLFLLFTNHPKTGSALPSALIVALLAFAVYVPGGFYMERFMWKRRMRGDPVLPKRGR
jgi:hypothetical protein